MLNETEGMYTPAEERSEQLVRKLWKHQLMAFWTCVSRVLMHHPTRNASKSTWTNAVTFSVPLWVHPSNEAKAQQSYNTLQEIRIDAERVDSPARCHGPQPKHLLWCLLFMKNYGVEETHAARVGCDEKTFRKWAWLYAEGVAKLDRQFVRSFDR